MPGPDSRNRRLKSAKLKPAGDVTDFTYKALFIDVKTRTRTPGYKGALDLALTVPNPNRPKDVKSDIYILAEAQGYEGLFSARVVFHGWTTKAALVLNGEPIRFKRVNWGLRAAYLYTMPELLERLK